MMVVYAMVSEDSSVKVGVSRSIDQRLIDNSREGFGCCTLHFQTETLGNARTVENIAHDILLPFRIKGEWFRVSPDDAVDAIKKAVTMANDGAVAAVKGNRAKQRAMREREKQRGLMRKLVRIPKDKDGELDEIVRKWMDEHGN